MSCTVSRPPLKCTPVGRLSPVVCQSVHVCGLTAVAVCDVGLHYSCMPSGLEALSASGRHVFPTSPQPPLCAGLRGWSMPIKRGVATFPGSFVCGRLANRHGSSEDVEEQEKARRICSCRGRGRLHQKKREQKCRPKSHLFPSPPIQAAAVGRGGEGTDSTSHTG